MQYGQCKIPSLMDLLIIIIFGFPEMARFFNMIFLLGLVLKDIGEVTTEEHTILSSFGHFFVRSAMSPTG